MVWCRFWALYDGFWQAERADGKGVEKVWERVCARYRKKDFGKIYSLDIGTRVIQQQNPTSNTLPDSSFKPGNSSEWFPLNVNRWMWWAFLPGLIHFLAAHLLQQAVIVPDVCRSHFLAVLYAALFHSLRLALLTNLHGFSFLRADF